MNMIFPTRMSNNGLTGRSDDIGTMDLACGRSYRKPVAGLTTQPYRNKDVLESGSLLKKEFWHCGYAREAAEGCKRYAFEQLKRDRVSSIIKSDNLASIRVAESIGMRKEDTFLTRYYSGEMLHFLYSVYRETRC